MHGRLLISLKSEELPKTYGRTCGKWNMGADGSEEDERISGRNERDYDL